MPNLKAALRKIISDATSRASEDDEDLEMAEGHDVGFPRFFLGIRERSGLMEAKGRKYLAYDLEALYSSITSQPCCQVVVAFQDSEGFDGGLLSDLITLFRYVVGTLWPRRILMRPAPGVIAFVLHCCLGSLRRLTFSRLGY